MNKNKRSIPKLKLIALLSGGDWADAQCEHILVPAEVDLNIEYAKYKNWLRMEYSVGQPFKTFYEWLLEKGARGVGEDDVLEFYEI